MFSLIQKNSKLLFADFLRFHTGRIFAAEAGCTVYISIVPHSCEHAFHADIMQAVCTYKCTYLIIAHGIGNEFFPPGGINPNNTEFVEEKLQPYAPQQPRLRAASAQFSCWWFPVRWNHPPLLSACRLQPAELH